MPPEQDINRLFGVLLAALRKGSLTNARLIAAAAGITGVNHGGQYWDPFLTAVDREFFQLDQVRKEQTLRILADRLVDDDVRSDMTKLGYDYVAGSFVPVEQFDLREAQFVPRTSASELGKAMKRLTEGDESGSITAACGSVDAIMSDIYTREKLGDPGRAAFAAKVNTAAQHLNIFVNLKNELVQLGIPEPDSMRIIDEWRQATNHAAQMLQTLRSKMGDVHGSKSALRRAAYDAIKWSSAICALFDER